MRMIVQLIRKADFSALSPGLHFQSGKVDLSSLEPMDLSTALHRCEAQKATVHLGRIPRCCRQGECSACKPGRVREPGGHIWKESAPVYKVPET